MNFFNKIFSTDEISQPKVIFGRNFELIKSEDQLKKWDLAVLNFEEERYLDSIENFLLFLMDPASDTVKYSRSTDQIQFSICQGSKIIQGFADEQWFRAKVDIIKNQEHHIGMYRRLLESSYNLMYGRYALTEDHYISILFDGFVQETSPFKLLYGLKEIGLRADKEDDLLLSEFSQVEAIQSTHIKELPLKEKEIKFSYYKKWLALALSDQHYGFLNKSKSPGAAVYVYLSTLYKIDYLLRPEGKLMDTIETAHKKYFSKNEESLNNKVVSLEKVCNILSEFSQEEIYKELYLVAHTFPITNQITTIELAEHIEVELEAMKWYYENGHFKICEAICGYIAANSFFNFTLPGISHALLHIYFEMTETEYFKDLDYELNYDLENQLEKSIKELEKKCRKILSSDLNFKKSMDQLIKFDAGSKIDFLISYLRFIQSIQY